MFEVSMFMKRSPDRVNVLLNFLILLLALFALGINLFLLIRRLGDPSAGLAGCGGGDCAEVLSSRWALVMWVPVTALGALVWIGLMASLTEKFRRFFQPLLGSIVGAALWFVFVQVVILKMFCPWCMTAHGVGLLVFCIGWVRIGRRNGFYHSLKALGFWVYTAFLGIGLIQVYGPVPATHRIADGAGVREAENTPVQWRGNGPKAVFLDGQKTFDVSALPHLGPVNAKRVVAEYFDYTCPACRTMSQYMEVMLEKHPVDFCVVVLPVPLERSCNVLMDEKDSEHAGSCEITKLALSVWRCKPDAYPALHHWLMEAERPVEIVRGRVAELLSSAELDAARNDPWIDQLIQANIADWVWYSAHQTRNLPKILTGGKHILHGLPSTEREFIQSMKKETGL